MTSDFPTATTPSYASAADVAAILQRPSPSEHVDDGEASLSTYNSALMAQEEVIDRWCRTSWRERRVTEEYPVDGLGNLWDLEGFVQVNLRHMDVRALSAASQDKLEVWNGSSFDDWVASHTQGRQGDWYLVPEHGILKLRTRVIYGEARDRVRVTYRYGQTAVPHTVKRACALLAAAELVKGMYTSQSGQGQGTDFVPADGRARAWAMQAQALLGPHVAVGGI